MQQVRSIYLLNLLMHRINLNIKFIVDFNQSLLNQNLFTKKKRIIVRDSLKISSLNVVLIYAVTVRGRVVIQMVQTL